MYPVFELGLSATTGRLEAIKILDLFVCLGQAIPNIQTSIMAPIKDETVDGLRDLVSKLELRVEQLEAKLEQTTGGSAARKSRPSPNGIRMILMGPPGAGMGSEVFWFSLVD